MIEKVISGGQTGVDQAGWRAAKAAGIATGGWMPKGFLTEDGLRPKFAELYGAKEHDSSNYPERTKANARDSDGTLWIGRSDSRGFGCTINACRLVGKPHFLCDFNRHPRDVCLWINANQIKILNIAGNRESSDPGIGEWAERHLLAELFSLLATQPNE